MKFLVAFSCLLAVACAKPGVVAPVGYSSYSTSTNVVSGQYAPVAYSAYSYAPVAHTAVATPVVSHNVAAPVVNTYAAPVVSTAPVVNTYAAPVVSHNVAAAPVVNTYAAPAPVVAHSAVAAPVVAHTAPAVVKTQYHAQNEIGQASYGHTEPFQTHNAVQDAAGNKVGSYSYVAPNGQVIATNYVADALGYRVASNAAPGVVVDTPEVAAAKLAHYNEQVLARRRGRRSVVAYHAAPVVHSAYYTAPVVRAATYSQVVHNPGHAVAYHVY